MTITTTTGGQPLIAAQLVTPPIHIPNGKGGAYKTELAVERSPEKTIKILWWHEDDPRPEPHNHPWPFKSDILSGGYSEHRYWVQNGQVVSEIKTYRAGDVNDMPANVFHVVYDVQPQTVTRLTCGAAAPDNEWGYLDVETGAYTSARDPKFADNSFIEKLRAINPHMRKLPPTSVLRKVFGEKTDFVLAAMAGDQKKMDEEIKKLVKDDR